MPEIIYIMGTARSGSTILEILLAANPQAFGAGEVAHIFRDGFLDDALCACGNRTSGCAVWGEARRRLGWGRDELDEIARLARRVEWHAGFPRLLLGLVPRSILGRHRAVQQLLFDNLVQVTGRGTIVDSSKYPGRALALARAFPDRVWTIALTRSPEGLLAAFGKPNPDEQKPKSLLAATLYYLYVATATRLTAAVLGKRALRLRFEQLAADPAGTLQRIEQWCGLDLSAARERLKNHGAFDVGHIVTGNRLRSAGRVRFDPLPAESPVTGGAARAALFVMKLCRALLNL